MKYKGATPVKPKDRVLLTMGEEEFEAVVIDALASQFTCKIPYTKQVRFYLYADKGLTWKPLK